MSSFKNFSSMLNDLQQQADGRGTLDGSAIEDFLSIAGYEQEGGGGGGGGGGDFSTATVTITNDSESPVTITNFPCISLDENFDSSAFIGAGTTNTYEAVLYKGSSENAQYADEGTVAVTGDIVYDDGYFTITGAGTITITEPPMS